MTGATKHNNRPDPRIVNTILGHGIIGAADVTSNGQQRVLHQHLPALRPSKGVDATTFLEWMTWCRDCHN